jgi:integrase
MNDFIGDPEFPVWLIGDSPPEKWMDKLDYPLDMKHPARHNIWTSVADQMQDRLFRHDRKDLVENGVWITREKRADRLREMLPVNTELIAELTRIANKKKDAHLFPYTKQAAWLALKLAVRAAGCRETIHPHLFRHGFGHRAYQATKDILLVQRMMGHRSTSSTEGYSKPTMSEVREAFRNINKRE